jgi:hypothetical protein
MKLIPIPNRKIKDYYLLTDPVIKRIKKDLFTVLSPTSILLFIAFLACSSDDNLDTNPDTTDPIIDSSIETNYDISGILSKFSGIGLSYEVKGNTVIFTTSDLPNHKSPYYPADDDLYEAYNGTNSNFRKNPNTIASQNIVLTISLNPAVASNHQATPLGPIGISRNGVVFYNQYAGPNQPLTNEINSFDQFMGHPQQSGQYHYHIEPKYLTDTFGDGAFLGLLSDGFPVYGPVENGKTITNNDLDEYHGHTGVTTDFPDGIYHYHITSDDPYLNGSAYYGTPGNITN